MGSRILLATRCLAAGLACLPALASTTTFSFSAKGTSGSTQTSPTSINYQATGTGTATPFGNATITLAGSANATSASTAVATGTLTVTFGNGDSIQFSYVNFQFTFGKNGSNGMGSGTVSSGTGAFQNATGIVNFTYSDTKLGHHVSAFTLTGSGTINSSGATRVITVSPPSLAFSFPLVQAPIVSEPIVVNNGMQQSETYTARAFGGSWLNVEPANGTVQAFSIASLLATANATGRSPGTYYGSIEITAGGETFTIAVTMTISVTKEGLLLSQQGLRFEVEVGAGAPSSQAIVVDSPIPGSENWTALASSSGWLSVTPSSGTISGPILATVSVNPTGLAPGNYSGTVEFTETGATPQFLIVVLTVTPANAPPAPTVLPTGAIFFGQQNGKPPASQVVTIANPSTQPVNVSASALYLNAGGWLNVNPPSATVPPSQAVEFTLSVNQAGLPEGEDQATLAFQFGDGSKQVVDVVLGVVNFIPGGSAADQSTKAADAAAKACTPTELLPVSTMLGREFNVTAAFPVPIEVLVVDNCGSSFNTGAVGLSFSSGDPALALTPLGKGRWTGTWQPLSLKAQPELITVVAASPHPFITGTRQISGKVQPNPNTPAISAGGVVSSASYVAHAPVAPGDLITVFGQDLAAGALTKAPGVPLPTKINGTKVFLAGEKMPLTYVSSGQIGAQVPYDAPENTTLQLMVQQNGDVSLPAMVTIAPAAPAVFTADGSGKGLGHILVVKPNGTQYLADPNHPASVGDMLVIYSAGLGPVNPPVNSGAPAPAKPVSKTMAKVTATIGGVAANVEFSGLVPGKVGIYQVNAIVPKGVKPGPNVPIVIAAAGESSPPVTIPIQ